MENKSDAITVFLYFGVFFAVFVLLQEKEEGTRSGSFDFERPRGRCVKLYNRSVKHINMPWMASGCGVMFFENTFY